MNKIQNTHTYTQNTYRHTYAYAYVLQCGTIKNQSEDAYNLKFNDIGSAGKTRRRDMNI